MESVRYLCHWTVDEKQENPHIAIEVPEDTILACFIRVVFANCKDFLSYILIFIYSTKSPLDKRIMPTKCF